MSTVLDAPAPTATGSRTGTRAAIDRNRKVTLWRVTAAEWLKFRTLRSSWLTLHGEILDMHSIVAVNFYKDGNHWTTVDAEDRVPSGALEGYHMALLLIGVLGVLFVTGEYGTGMIRSTLAAVPRRWPVLAAKTWVIGLVSLISMTAASFAAFYSAQAFLSYYGHGTSITSPGLLRIVIGGGVYLTLVALLGSAIGWIVRSTAGGISTLVGLVMVLPLLAGLLPGSVGDTVNEYLPSTAGESFIHSVQQPNTLGPWAGLSVMIAWVVAALVVAAVVLRRRDA